MGGYRPVPADVPGLLSVRVEGRRFWPVSCGVAGAGPASLRGERATREESARLGLAEGTPVAEHVRTSWAADGTPVRVQVCVLPGDRNVMIYELGE